MPTPILPFNAACHHIKWQMSSVPEPIFCIIQRMTHDKPEIVDEVALIARLQAGDQTACAVCVDQYATQIYRLAVRLMGNEADAEDVVQETFLAAWKAIGTFEGRSTLSTWLYRITHNTAMMRLRRKTPLFVSVDETLQEEKSWQVPQQLFDWCCLPAEEFETEEVRSELEQTIMALPPTLKSVFLLRDVEGLSTREAAAVLEISEAAVKKRLQRARFWLRERLADYFSEHPQLTGV